MAITIDDLWSLLAKSGLVSASQSVSWRGSLARSTSVGPHPDAAAVAAWLVRKGGITEYQAKVLLAGAPGPFDYGDYRVVERIDAGRLGGMFRAVHRPSKHTTLLYFFSGPALTDPDAWSRIAALGAVASGISHAKLARVFELVDLTTRRFAVLEDLHGRSLAERDRVALKPEAACRVARDMAEGLSRLHMQGIAHGDVRPANIWVESGAPARVLWFPLARDPLAPGSIDVSSGGAERLLAMADYCAPELTEPGRAPDALSDVYALGCVLYEMLDGRVPFPGGDVADKMRRHATEAIEPLERQPGVTPQLAKAVAFMMAKNAAIRTPSMEAVMAALAPWSGGAVSSGRASGSATLMQFEASLRAPRNAPMAVVRESAVGSHPEGTRRAVEEKEKETEQQFETDGLISDDTPFMIEVAVPPVAGAIESSDVALTAAAATIAPRAEPAKRARQKGPVIVGSVVVGLAALVVLGIVVWGGSNRPAGTQEAPRAEETAEKNPPPPVAETPPKNAADAKPVVANKNPPAEEAASVTLVEDDGQTLWAAPTEGKPIDLAFTPGGSQMFLVLRPADLLASPEGEKAVDSLGPASRAARAKLEAILGLPLTEIEQLIISFYSLESGPPQMALVARAKGKPEAPRWQEARQAAATEEGKPKFSVADEWGYYSPPDKDQTLVIAAPAAIEEIISHPDPPPRLAMEWLVRATDQTRHVTLLAAPHYILVGDGRTLLSGDLDKLRAPLEWFLQDESIQVVALSAQFGDDFFVELRAIGPLDLDPHKLATRLRDRLALAPERIENYVVALQPRPYGSFILRRFPDMVTRLQEFTRAAADGKTAVLRSYLPGPAGHNLTLGSQLVLAERAQPAGATAAPSGGTPAPAADPLKAKITISFAKDTLENCLAMIAQEIETPIEIVGPDLQLEGITKNQSFALDEQEKPAAEILKIVLQKANPDGKLVYVIKPGPPGGKKTLVITTRAAAKKRGDSIPPELDR